MSAAFTGTSKSLGIELYRGSIAYIEHVNRTGGVHGQKIVIKAYDDGYNPIPAIQNTIKLVERRQRISSFQLCRDSHGDAGSCPSSRATTISSSISFLRLRGRSPSGSLPMANMFLICGLRTSDEIEGLVDNFVSAGRKRIAVFYQADAYGRSGWDGVKKSSGEEFGSENGRRGDLSEGSRTFSELHRTGRYHQEDVRRMPLYPSGLTPSALRLSETLGTPGSIFRSRIFLLWAVRA